MIFFFCGNEIFATMPCKSTPGWGFDWIHGWPIIEFFRQKAGSLWTGSSLIADFALDLVPLPLIASAIPFTTTAVLIRWQICLRSRCLCAFIIYSSLTAISCPAYGRSSSLFFFSMIQFDCPIRWHKTFCMLLPPLLLPSSTPSFPSLFVRLGGSIRTGFYIGSI